jgi:hypothetical protein
MKWYSSFGCTLNYRLSQFQYFLKSFVIAFIEYWRDHHVKFQVNIVLRCGNDQRVSGVDH